MTRTLLILTATAALIACGDSTGPPASIAGTWEGRCVCSPYDAEVTMVLSHDTGSGEVTGSGAWSEANLTISGAADVPNVSLTLVAPAGQFSPGTMSWSGALSGSQLTGTLSGPEFSTTQVTFTRQ